jgi:hypothetical protein
MPAKDGNDRRWILGALFVMFVLLAFGFGTHTWLQPRIIRYTKELSWKHSSSFSGWRALSYQRLLPIEKRGGSRHGSSSDFSSESSPSFPFYFFAVFQILPGGVLSVVR